MGKFIRTAERSGYSVVIIGTVAFPWSFLAIGGALLWVALMIVAALADTMWGAGGLGAAWFFGGTFGIALIVLAVWGIPILVRTMREVNRP